MIFMELLKKYFLIVQMGLYFTTVITSVHVKGV
jgi:hypothetical protein